MSAQTLLAARLAYAQTFVPRLAIDSYKPGHQWLYKAMLLTKDGNGHEKSLSDRMPYRGIMDWLDGYIAGLEAQKETKE